MLFFFAKDYFCALYFRFSHPRFRRHLIRVFSGTILISVIYRQQPDCSPTGPTMTQRLIGIYPEVAMVPQAILAVFDDNFGKQRRVQVGVHYVKSRTEERALRHT